jgi:hypothetical protein
MNKIITAPLDVPILKITMGLGLSSSEKYTYEIDTLTSFSQEIKKGSLWNNPGDVYNISFNTIPIELKNKMEHSGYQILEIQFIFDHRTLDGNDINTELILTHPSVLSSLNSSASEYGKYTWKIYNTWTHTYKQRD